MYDDENRATDAACRELLDHVLQDERAWMSDLAPGGVPSPGLAALIDRGSPEFSGRPLRVRWLGLLGEVLWDVFSDNHDVVGPDGELYDLGSFRGSADFIADVVNDRLPDDLRAGPSRSERGWGVRGVGAFVYLDFYMGTLGADKGRVRPFYVRVFERLRERGCDWRYASPSLGAVRLTPTDSDDDPATYDPLAALAEAATQSEKNAAFEKLSRDFAEANAEAFETSVRDPPPVVRSYMEVFGGRPRYVRR
ncbi:hypothetical protein RQM47_16820 [Rubrivirga sp. S365]|uniref:hypothetical protein n=1 Tax=Rubrivirga sp. S365 TaxID=3076080 RepID=UPI0028C7A095|nr:hypothetical protein [Rubrivirga sp. S365]MDT7858314.1 hypothetical protein [Rubrivirga sp. S365]